MKIRRPWKAVVTAAGLGTRLLPMTKELPKEMLPLYVKTDGDFILKPLLQELFEQLYRFGIKDFCFVVGRGKRAIEDHFTPDSSFVEKMNNSVKPHIMADVQRFYGMISNANLSWINQPEPKGFGHAVLLAKSIVNETSFLVTAGDTLIISARDSFLERMNRAFLHSNVSAVLLLQQVEDPRAYGVATVSPLSEGVLKITSVAEKPSRPRSNLAIMPFYIFTSKIFSAIDSSKPGVGGEVQLTDGIQKLIDGGERVVGVTMSKHEVRLDIGSPGTYWEAIQNSYKYCEWMK